MVKIRPANRKDKAAVSRISIQSWESEGEFDYVPQAFDKWLTDKKGQFVVAEMAGEVVGCAKLSVIDENVAWLEGLRVMRSKQGLGIGRALQKHFLDQTASFSAIRLSTFIGNHASLHLIKKNGFSEMARFTVYEAMAETSKANFNSIEQPHELEEIWSYLDHTALHNRNNFIGCEWVFKKLTRNLIHDLITEQSVFGIYKANKLQALMLLSDKHCKECGFSINYLQYNSIIDAKLLLEFAKHKSSTSKLNKVISMCPDSAELRRLFIENKFYSYTSDINNVFVFELKHHRKG